MHEEIEEDTEGIAPGEARAGSELNGAMSTVWSGYFESGCSRGNDTKSKV
jgi:hypothetical protein